MYLSLFISDDRFYADSYGSGLSLRGVLLHFLHQYSEAHQSFDEVMKMFVKNQLKRTIDFINCIFV